MSLNEQGRRWESVVERSRARLAARSRTLPPNVADAVEQAFDTCDVLVKELAGRQAEVADLRKVLAGLAGEWGQLFAAMPLPCILTDPAGTVRQSNQAAAALLNVSSRHLEGRVMTYFIEDRARFLAALNELPHLGDRFSACFRVRPRERAPLEVDMIAVRHLTGGQPGWLWFFTRSEERPRERERTKRSRPSAPTAECPTPAAPTDAAGRYEEQSGE